MKDSMKRKHVATLALACAAFLTLAFWPQSDAKSSKLIVGSWQAVDPANSALHGRKDGAQREVAEFAPDGKLAYRVLPLAAPAATQPAKEVDSSWGWKLQNGRLMVRDMGPESTGEWMQPLKVSVSRKSLSLYRKGFPTKEFARID